MKTTDLIPIILYQLVDGDRYGYEIVKQIEDYSNGRIVIKQPTLYSVLKKLEQGRFISSYWQDSEIGGKRHYYKLTDNGRAQLDTYPALDKLVRDALEDDGFSMPTAPSNNDNAPRVQEQAIDTVDATEQSTDYNDINEIKPIHIDLTTSYEETASQPIYNIESPTLSIDNQIDNQEDEPIFDYNVEQSDDESTEDENVFADLATSETEEIVDDNSINGDDTLLDFDANKSDDTPIIEDTSSEENEDTLTENKDETIPTNPMIVEVIEENDPPRQHISIFDAIDFEDVSSTKLSDTENTSSPISQEETTELSEQTIQEQQAEQDEAPKFTEKVDDISEPYVVNKLYDQLTPNTEIATHTLAEPQTVSPLSDMEEVKYLNYVDLSVDKNSLKRKKAIKLHTTKMILTCLSLVLMFALNTVICFKYSFGKLYYVCAIITCLTAILYPITLINNLPKIRYKYCSKPFKYSVFRDLFVKLTLFLTFVISILAYNISCTTTISEIFTLANCGNFLCPILFSVVIMLDFVYSVLCYKNYK